ncbi:MAG: Transcriptional regulator [Cenarchaeum symbiont of Oopsacas minuta]|nr:Transcriptional regulator [Cenarchaeum symbiont of Oopsacas minuta]
MKHKATLPQLKKFDVTQKIVVILADVEARAIIFSMVRESMTASDLSQTLKIPLSSVYKKLSDLKDLGLIDVEKNVLTKEGKKHKFYRSRIKDAEIVIKKFEPILTIHPNTKHRN